MCCHIWGGGGRLRCLSGGFFWLSISINVRVLAWHGKCPACRVHTYVLSSAHTRHDVYDYIDPCFNVSIQHLIYSGQFQPFPTHNMLKVCEDGSLQDCADNLFFALQPPHVRHPPGRPRQRRIESQFTHKRAIHCSRCNGIGHNRSKCNNPLPWHVACMCLYDSHTLYQPIHSIVGYMVRYCCFSFICIGLVIATMHYLVIFMIYSCFV